MNFSRIIFLFLFPIVLSSQNKNIDSLLSLLPKKPDTTKVLILGTVADAYQFNSLEKALFYADSAYKFAIKIKYANGIAYSLQLYGSIYTTAGKYDLAIKYIHKALPYLKELKKTYTVANCYNTLGNIYMGINDTNRAFTYYTLSHSLSKVNNLTTMQIISGVGLGNILIQKQKFKEAKNYITAAINYFEKNRNTEYLASGYTILSEIYVGLGQFKEAEKNLLIANELFSDIESKYGMAMTLMSLSKVQDTLGKKTESVNNLTKALKLNLERKALDNIRETAYLLAKLSESRNDLKSAVENYKIYIQYNDSVFNAEKVKTTSELATQYETKEKENELKLKNIELEASENRVKSKNVLIIIFIIASALFLGFVILLIRQIIKNKKVNFLLQKQNSKIQFQKDIIENKNKDITDSINYAKHIQQALMPSASVLKQYVKEYFIIYKPKDIVSGDFYFVEHHNDSTYIAVVDCTGHGVPGAMLSVFMHTNLIRIIKSENLANNPAQILTEMCVALKSNLNKDRGKQINDGADIGICVINKNQLVFAGAKLNLVKVDNSTIEIIKGDRISISSSFDFENNCFSNQFVNYSARSTFYMSTDGFGDQFGGSKDGKNKPEGKKFKQTNLYNLILTYNSLPLLEQADHLLNDFYEWKGKYEQTDDVTVIGFMI
ncbi:MAG: SpoIIE family protein phosphatase [Bacteroidota bacterium]